MYVCMYFYACMYPCVSNYYHHHHFHNFIITRSLSPSRNWCKWNPEMAKGEHIKGKLSAEFSTGS